MKKKNMFEQLFGGNLMKSPLFFIIMFLVVVIIALVVGFVVGISMTFNIIIVGLLVIAIPYFIYQFFEFKKIKAYEDQFPNFLRDLSGSLFAGLSMIQAIQSLANSNYGELTKEIKKINNQISWNIPMEDVLASFSDRMKRSEVISMSLMVMSQAQKSGGDMQNILGSLADNIEKIKDVESEKRTLLGQQVTMMYAIFFIFIGISITLIMFLVPLLQSNAITQMGSIGGLGGGDVNPCQICVDNPDPGCFSCGIITHVSNTFSFGGVNDPQSYYKSLFFLMIIIQGVCSGLVAGQIGSDSVVGGIKHSLIMVVSGFVVFLAAAGLGFI